MLHVLKYETSFTILNQFAALQIPLNMASYLNRLDLEVWDKSKCQQGVLNYCMESGK